jgi:PEP-CTERM motif-containing protein
MRILIRVILTTLVALTAPAAWGAPITLDVNPAYVGNAPRSDFSFNFPTAGLNGLTFSGQTLSLDFVFADALVGRAIGTVPERSTAGATLEIFTTGTFNPTDPNSGPGFPGIGSTGYFFTRDIFQEVVGRGMSPSRGSLLASIDVRNDQAFNGLHYDLILPATGYEVTGTTLSFFANGAPITAGEWWGIQFGTPEQVPEPATLVLLTTALLGVGAGAWRRRRYGRRAALIGLQLDGLGKEGA